MRTQRHFAVPFLIPTACLALGVGSASTLAARTVSSSETTTRSASGAQTRTPVSEPATRGANGVTLIERKETNRTTTPAPRPMTQP